MENFVPPCGIGTFHPLAKRKLTKRIPMTFGVWSFGQLRAGGRQTAVVGRSSDLTGGSPLEAAFNGALKKQEPTPAVLRLQAKHFLELAFDLLLSFPSDGALGRMQPRFGK